MYAGSTARCAFALAVRWFLLGSTPERAAALGSAVSGGPLPPWPALGSGGGGTGRPIPDAAHQLVAVFSAAGSSTDRSTGVEAASAAVRPPPLRARFSGAEAELLEAIRGKWRRSRCWLAAPAGAGRTSGLPALRGADADRQAGGPAGAPGGRA